MDYRIEKSDNRFYLFFEPHFITGKSSYDPQLGKAGLASGLFNLAPFSWHDGKYLVASLTCDQALDPLVIQRLIEEGQGIVSDMLDELVRWRAIAKIVFGKEKLKE